MEIRLFSSGCQGLFQPVEVCVIAYECFPAGVSAPGKSFLQYQDANENAYGATDAKPARGGGLESAGGCKTLRAIFPVSGFSTQTVVVP